MGLVLCVLVLLHVCSLPVCITWLWPLLLIIQQLCTYVHVLSIILARLYAIKILMAGHAVIFNALSCHTSRHQTTYATYVRTCMCTYVCVESLPLDVTTSKQLCHFPLELLLMSILIVCCTCTYVWMYVEPVWSGMLDNSALASNMRCDIHVTLHFSMSVRLIGRCVSILKRLIHYWITSRVWEREKEKVFKLLIIITSLHTAREGEREGEEHSQSCWAELRLRKRCIRGFVEV